MDALLSEIVAIFPRCSDLSSVCVRPSPGLWQTYNGPQKTPAALNQQCLHQNSAFPPESTVEVVLDIRSACDSKRAVGIGYFSGLDVVDSVE